MIKDKLGDAIATANEIIDFSIVSYHNSEKNRNITI